MKYVANSTCRPKVDNLQEFSGSNLYGTWHGERERYVVYSYGPHWPLYVWDEEAKRWFGNREKYTLSTNRHSRQARPTSSHITWLTRDEMESLERYGVGGLICRKIEAAANQGHYAHG